MSKPKRLYLKCCVDFPARSGQVILDAMESSRQISLEHFRTLVDRAQFRDLQRILGYSVGPGNGLHLKNDHHVGFYNAKLLGKSVSIMQHSAIEFFFVNPNDLPDLIRATS